jgi:flagellin-like protein
MKSITPVISIILLVALTITASGAAFFFINSNVVDLQSQGNIDTYPGSDNSRLNLVSITGTKAIVRNDGTSPVTEVVMFVNNELLNYTLDTPILPGQLREINFAARQSGEDLTIKVIYNSGKTVSDVSLASKNSENAGFTSNPSSLNPQTESSSCDSDIVNFENTLDFSSSNDLGCGCDSYSLTINSLTNGGFETGDFTDWDEYDEVFISSLPHSGVYSANVTTYDSGPRIRKILNFLVDNFNLYVNISSLNDGDFVHSVNLKFINESDDFPGILYLFDSGDWIYDFNMSMMIPGSDEHVNLCEDGLVGDTYIDCTYLSDTFDSWKLINITNIKDHYSSIYPDYNLSLFNITKFNIEVSFPLGGEGFASSFVDDVFIGQPAQGYFCDINTDNLADGVCNNEVCEIFEPDENSNFCEANSSVWFTGNLIGNNTACCGDDGDTDNFYNSTNFCCGGILDDGTCHCGDGTCQIWEDEGTCFTDCELINFTSVWDTTITSFESSNTTQIKLPLVINGDYDFTVFWGDESSDVITIWNQSEINHTYTSPGIYEVNMSGRIKGWSFSNTGDVLKLSEIKQWGDLRLLNSGGYFHGCANLFITATDIINLVETTSMANMFKACSNISQIPNINLGDTSSVTNMEGVFSGASKFNQSLNYWDTNKVTNMNGMFYQASNFNQSLNDWNTSSVTDMARLFQYTQHFYSNLSNWDVSKVTNMYSMFTSTKSRDYYISSWDTSSVTSMSNMFMYSEFDGNISSWDTSNVDSMEHMFEDADNFNQNIGNWNMSNAQHMYGMFKCATSFNQNISGWDTSKMITFANMFYGATSFDQNLSSWNVSSVGSMTSMFSGANLSTANYDALLIGWAGLSPNLKNNVPFSAGNSNYCTASSSKIILNTTHSWTITDGGYDCS